MLKLRLIQPGHSDVELSVQGDSAVLGRDEKCDVVVNQPFVSRRHIQILRGIVVVDLQSGNGTFVEGQKITKPTLLTGGTFNLAERLDVVVEGDASPASTDSPRTKRDSALKVVREELEAERARAAVLSGNLAEAQAQLQGGGEHGDARLSALQAENQDLRARLASLKEEVEGREVDAAASLQARLADQQLQEALRRNQELKTRLAVLEARSREVPARGAAPELEPSASDAELARLREELERARKAALPPSEFFAQMQRENQELRDRLVHFESGAANPAIPASELFFQLQSENRELRQKLERLEASPPSTVRAKPRAGTASGKEQAEIERLRAALTEAEGELERQRRELAAQRKGEPSPLRSSSIGARAPAGTSVLHIARLVAERDIERVESKDVTCTEDFFVLETLRFVRGAERVVTRVAGELIQLYDLHTILPNVEGNLRTLTRAVVNDPTDEKAQRELARYLEELGRWLVVAVGAPRKAALEFTMQLKQALTEEALTQGKPIPALKGRQAELWKRACDYLKELSPELIEDQLEKLGRKTAQVLLGSKEDAS